jgi:hypothetical protein
MTLYYYIKDLANCSQDICLIPLLFKRPSYVCEKMRFEMGRMFENKGRRISLGRTRVKEAEKGRELRSEGLRNLYFFSISRIRSLAYSGFYEFHLLRGLPGSLLPLGLYQRACSGTHPSSSLSTC